MKRYVHIYVYNTYNSPFYASDMHSLMTETCSSYHDRYNKVLSLCILPQIAHLCFTQISENLRMYSVVSTSVFSFQTHKELKDIYVGNLLSLVFTGYWRYIPEVKR
jgi:hypothetical protein